MVVVAKSPKGKEYVGGIIRPDVVRRARVTGPVQVGWSWADESQGLVEWTFSNPSEEQQSVVLLRNGYYFGNAFWPVYLTNSSFDTSWVTALIPLADNGVQSNSAPLGIVDFGNGQLLVAFVFTIGPGQKWSMLEGGFSSSNPPVFQAAPTVTLEKTGTFCVGYDPSQVSDWDAQTGTSLQGYAPNPSAFTVAEVQVQSGAPYVTLFNDPITVGECAASPSPTGTCFAEIVDGIEQENMDEVISGILCLMEELGIRIETLLLHKVEQEIHKVSPNL